jgi:hypothetical protein
MVGDGAPRLTHPTGRPGFGRAPSGLRLLELDEIEITPEMIEAGVEELYSHPILQPDDQSMALAVSAVFRTMLALSPRCARGVS